MKRYAILIIVFLFLAGVPTASFGEFYKYKDANGVTRFTDNLAEVPPDQRPKVEAYAEPSDFITPEQKARQEKETSTRDEPPENRPVSTPEAKEAETSEQRAARLREEKQRIETEYNEIMNTQETLSAEKKTLKSPASYQDYNKKQQRLRQRAEAYEKKRQAFEQKVEAHNLSLEVTTQVK